LASGDLRGLLVANCLSLPQAATWPLFLFPQLHCPFPAWRAGILQEQVEAVQKAYRPWFTEFEVQGEDRWALVTAVRRRDGDGAAG
jgi:ribosomal protein L11 methylase PrmA